MKSSTRQTVIWVWVIAVLLIGSVGSDSLQMLRVANGLGALGCALLAYRSVRRGRTGGAIAFGVLTVAFAIFAALPAVTRPVWAFLLMIIDEF